MMFDTVLQIDEVGMTFKAKFSLWLVWRDWRVMFRDLKFINTLNEKEKSQIWIPSLIFENGQDGENGFSTKSGQSERLIVFRDNLEAFQVMNSLDEGRLYRDQSLVYSSWFTKQFSCDFDLHHYPFDIQKCQIKLRVPRSMQRSINLIPGASSMVGPDHFSQFSISNVSMITFIPRVKIYSTINRSSHNVSAGAMLQFHIHRDITHHIYMTYIPTLFILIMSLFSLFIGEEHFGATTAVSMTCMLVLYTLYQGIVANMPVTTYMKLLDIWLIFNLAIPFFVFVTLVSWELLKGKPINQVMDYLPSEGWQRKKRYCKLAMQIILPGISALFVLTYFIVVVYVIFQQ